MFFSRFYGGFCLSGYCALSACRCAIDCDVDSWIITYRQVLGHASPSVLNDFPGLKPHFLIYFQ